MPGKSTRAYTVGLVASLAVGLALFCGALGTTNGDAVAQSRERDGTDTGASGLPVPRFVSLSVGRANLRTGPGERYPILWVYVREGLPLEITAEFGAWRRIRDLDGTVGWMHGRMLSGRRTAVISGRERVLRSDASPDSSPVLRAEPGVVAELKKCEGAWCRIEVRGRKAWLERESLWGTYKNEDIR